MKKPLIVLLSLFPFFVLVFLIRKEWGNPVMAVCIVYSVAVTFFFMAQLWGFVLSQTQYSESVEEAKFRVLHVEEKECQKFEKH